MKSFRNIKKNAKALSPVVASIILIAVTVAVSVVVAAWMGGMSVGLMGNAEQGTITNLDVSGSGNQIIATVQNTGNAKITLTTSYINGAVTNSTAYPLTVAKGATMSIALTQAGLTLTSGTDYTVKMTTSKGNNLVFTQTKP
jgi:archaeal type IV pilus assembly protein PilA